MQEIPASVKATAAINQELRLKPKTKKAC